MYRVHRFYRVFSNLWGLGRFIGSVGFIGFTGSVGFTGSIGFIGVSRVLGRGVRSLKAKSLKPSAEELGFDCAMPAVAV